MTIGVEIKEILKKYGVSRIRASLEGDILTIHIAKPKEVYAKEYYQKNKERIKSKQLEYYYKNREKLLDHKREVYEYNRKYHREYYRKNKDRIIKRQREYNLNNKEKIRDIKRRYYLRMKEKIMNYQMERYWANKKKTEADSLEHVQRYIPIPQDLARAMAKLYSKNGIEVRADDFLDTAMAVLQFFGFENEVVANHLEHEDLAVMYQLEDLGLVKTRIEEEILATNKIWRVNYFILDARKIKEYAAMEPQKKDEFFDLYDNLPEEVWVR